MIGTQIVDPGFMGRIGHGHGPGLGMDRAWVGHGPIGSFVGGLRTGFESC